MKKKLTNEEAKPIYTTISLLGVVYLIIIIIHFGFQFYDLDKLLSNIIIGILVVGFGWLVKEFYNFQTNTTNEVKKYKKEVKELRTDVKAINKLCNELLNKK